MKAVIFHQGALGDFLIAASVIDELAGDGALDRVDFWSKPEHASLLAGKDYLGQCHPADGSLIASLLQDSLWSSATLPDFLLDADRLLIFGQDGSRLMAERLSERLTAKVDWIQSFPVDKDNRTHVYDFLCAQMSTVGMPVHGNPFCLSPPVSERQAAKEILQNLGIYSAPILIHPGSGGRRKVWPLGNWHGLLEWILRESLYQPLLSIGPADSYLEGFSAAMRESGVPVVGGLSPLRLSALISECGLYIGSDSGVSHLAAAVGIQAITVFGPTDPDVWGPRRINAIAVRREWEEEDVLAWTPSEKHDFRDEEIAGIITNCGLLTEIDRSTEN